MSVRLFMMDTLSGFFGLLAVLLVVVGLYGVLSYFVTHPSHPHRRSRHPLLALYSASP